MANKIPMLALALTGCAVAASAYLIGHHSRRQDAQQHKDDLSTWEGEGGTPAPSAARPAQAS